MTGWFADRSAWQLIWLTLAVLLVITVACAVLGRMLVRRGMRAPFVVRRVNALRERVLDLVKRPITIAVLDEVADVMVTGHYTRNISAALEENHDELIELVREKVREDPSSRVVNRIPGYDLIVSQVTETTLRVLVEMLGDPRMDELVSDLLRNNLTQIKLAVRKREHEAVTSHELPQTEEQLEAQRRTQMRTQRSNGRVRDPVDPVDPLPRRNPPGPGA